MRTWSPSSRGKLKLTLRLDKGTVLASVREHTYRHHDPAITKPASIQRISLKPATAAARFSLGYVAQLD